MLVAGLISPVLAFANAYGAGVSFLLASSGACCLAPHAAGVAGAAAAPMAHLGSFGDAVHPSFLPQLTDWNMASLYGKLAIFIFAAWAGLEAGGVIAGLAVCGVVFASVSSASDLMQDFRTG